MYVSRMMEAGAAGVSPGLRPVGSGQVVALVQVGSGQVMAPFPRIVMILLDKILSFTEVLCF